MSRNASKSRLERKASATSTNIINAQKTYIPGTSCTEEEWNFVIEREKSEEVVSEIINEIMTKVDCMVLHSFVEKNTFNYAVARIKDDIIHACEWLYAKRDEEPDACYFNNLDDEEPCCLAMDSLCSGSIATRPATVPIPHREEAGEEFDVTVSKTCFDATEKKSIRPQDEPSATDAEKESESEATGAKTSQGTKTSKATKTSQGTKTSEATKTSEGDKNEEQNTKNYVNKKLLASKKPTKKGELQADVAVDPKLNDPTRSQGLNVFASKSTVHETITNEWMLENTTPTNADNSDYKNGLDSALQGKIPTPITKFSLVSKSFSKKMVLNRVATDFKVVNPGIRPKKTYKEEQKAKRFRSTILPSLNPSRIDAGLISKSDPMPTLIDAIKLTEGVAIEQLGRTRENATRVFQSEPMTDSVHTNMKPINEYRAEVDRLIDTQARVKSMQHARTLPPLTLQGKRSRTIC